MNTILLFSKILEMGSSPRRKEQALNKRSQNHFVHSQGDDRDYLIVVRANKHNLKEAWENIALVNNNNNKK